MIRQSTIDDFKKAFEIAQSDVDHDIEDETDEVISVFRKVCRDSPDTWMQIEILIQQNAQKYEGDLDLFDDGDTDAEDEDDAEWDEPYDKNYQRDQDEEQSAFDREAGNIGL